MHANQAARATFACSAAQEEREPGAGPCATLCAVTAAAVTAIVLAVLALLLSAAVVGLAVGLAGVARQLQEARGEVLELREALATEQAALRGPRTVQAAQAAGSAVKTLVSTATRVREQGVRGMMLSSIDDLATWAMEDRNEIVRMAAPDGTVTIMFSDIENSTAVNSELGDERWVKLLNAHNRLVQSCVEKNRGLVVKSQGDGYMVVFATAERALGAARDIQRELGAKRQRSRQLRRTPIRVRIGLHRGTAIEREGDFFGRNVAMAARVTALADGGDVLVTDEIAEELAGSQEYRFVRDDVVSLKGLPGEHQLWLVETP